MRTITVLGLTMVALVGIPLMSAAQTTTKEKVESKIDRAADATKDSWLTAKTKIALYADERVSGTSVNVDTRNGVVSLRGKVGSPEEKKAAEEVAKGVEGVRSVENQLQVVAPSERKAVEAKDDDLKGAVKTRLKRDDQLKKADIDVRVDKGVVTLTGDVKGLTERARASQVAREVPGVKAVKNELKEKS